MDPLEPGKSCTTNEITEMFIDACCGKFNMSAEDAKGGSPYIVEDTLLLMLYIHRVQSLLGRHGSASLAMYG